MRQQPEHFRVTELLDIEFSGSGEFDWVYIEKTAITTPEAAAALQSYSGARDASYSGLKDKDAITGQWLSLHMLGAASADWTAFKHPQIQVVASRRHHRKLRIGTHRYNAFELVLAGVTPEQLGERVHTIGARGVPNYFGEQRFGHNNFAQAQRWLLSKRKTSRFKRGLWLSVIRSQLFNAVLAERVQRGVWDRPLSGDLFCLGDGNSLFSSDNTADIETRLAQGDIQPSGPLAGRAGRIGPGGEAAVLESDVLSEYSDLLNGLARLGVEAGRRPLRVYPKALGVEEHEQGTKLAFELPRGCFATSLVRELIDY